MYKILSELAGFYRRCDKNILVCFFDLQFQQLLFTYKMRTLSFTRECSDIIQVRWETFRVLYDKFTQDSTHQILLQSAGFPERWQKHLGVFLRYTV